ncbi:MAG: O-antigen ligase family protein [Patescibacteria group bacterium]|nr:O-antigen ligase family protein [Patescibacteria group bacterium]
MSKLAQLLLILILLTVPFGQLARLPIGNNITVYPTDILIPILVVVWLIYAFVIRKKFYLPPLNGLIIIFILLLVTSLVNGSQWINRQELLVSSLYLVRWLEYLSLYFITWDLATSSPFLTRHFPQLLVLVGLLVAFFGFVQLVVMPDFSGMAAEGWDPHYGRLLSTFFDPNFVGGFLSLVFGLIVSYLIYSKDKKERLMLALSGLVVFIAVVLTFSRSSYLAFFVVLVIIGLLKSPKILLAFLVASLVAVTFLPRIQERIIGAFSLDATAQARFESWDRAGEILKDNPFLGIGYNTYRYAQERHGFFDFNDTTSGGHSGAGTDSSLLLILVTTGTIGFLSYCLLTLGILKKSWEKRNSPLGLAVLAGLFSLLIHSQFVNSLFYPQILVWFWILTGLAFAKEVKK